MSPETPYVETEILLAYLNCDDDRMSILLEDMLDGELARLRHALRALTWRVELEQERRRQ